jgi:DNA polymerase alpha-associated DNA helicase A
MAPTTEQISPQDFATTQLHLLSQELASELSENADLLNNTSPSSLARAGLALLNLTSISQSTGLGGRLVVELSLDSSISGLSSSKSSKSTSKSSSKTAGGESGGEGDLPEHGIRTGDIVSIAEQVAGSAKKKELKEIERRGVKGVVTRLGQRAVWVAVDVENGRDEDEGIDWGKRVWIVKLADEVTFKRYVLYCSYIWRLKQEDVVQTLLETGRVV